MDSMTEQQTLVGFLTARLDEDERWARLASQPPTELDPVPENGVHWEWVLGDGTPLEIPDSSSKRADGMLTEHGTLAWLATVEKFHHGEEDEPAIAGYSEGIHDMEGPAASHIVQHDPARVLHEVASKRALLALHCPDGLGRRVVCGECSNGFEVLEWAPEHPCPTVRILALAYADHPDYREEWKP